MEKIILFAKNISFEDIFNFVFYPRFEGALLYIKIIFIIISFILFTLAIWFFLISSWFKHRAGKDISEFITFKPLGVRKTPKLWLKIIKRLESGKESEYKLAVLEADGILENKLKMMGSRGGNLPEILEKTDSDILSDIEKVREARKVRDNIVNNPDYNLTSKEAKETVEIYRKALREMKIF